MSTNENEIGSNPEALDASSEPLQQETLHKAPQQKPRSKEPRWIKSHSKSLPQTIPTGRYAAM
ncbi:MAG: hypothetical protein ABR85_04400 [OM182 bacterium BACL3 MAG-120619-bin3]|uniref:Uncharacterized protein n=1 Tax=OM182 bacterium BACL3 MAG-120619-bin3 TaxID=1655593 RepID=A0A0R2TBC6_9GAMM|nr:MAG: hypothetical protein ABR85_04400 [OM182 bacterium BACL3 MAG-120619-bin3]